jgi:2-polyprenyl-3-methyl-5-hydroxy-6-metoxy-1,4-benzoquinol methylase
MTSQGHTPRPHAQDHDDPARWQQTEFVDQWVTRDDGRIDERLPMIQDAIGSVPRDSGETFTALDVGAGYGLLTTELLKRFPNAQVTLQDVSEPMLTHAKGRLADNAAQLKFITSDFSQSDWASRLGGPFDLVISAIAIHNMYDDDLISSVYKGIHDLMSPGATFVNLDYAGQSGGIDAHLGWLSDAGFEAIDCIPATDRISRLVARRKA